VATKIAPVNPSVPAAAEFRQVAGLEVLAWPVFDEYPVDVLVTTRQGGVSSGPHGRYATLNLSYRVGDAEASVTENRRRVAAALRASLGDFVFAEQVHGTHAEIVTAGDRGRGAAGPDGALPATDALVTRDPAPVLAVLAADCVPIVLYDPAAGVLGAVHAGWRGAIAGTARAAVAAMASLGATPRNLIAALGPAAAPDHYQVGEDVRAAAGQAFGPRARSLLRPDGPGKWLFDLWEANRLVLADAGVPARQIHVSGVPTGPQPGRFFSHRAEAPCGRFAAVARLRQLGGEPQAAAPRERSAP
jgi:YfiH family protein